MLSAVDGPKRWGLRVAHRVEKHGGRLGRLPLLYFTFIADRGTCIFLVMLESTLSSWVSLVPSPHPNFRGRYTSWCGFWTSPYLSSFIPSFPITLPRKVKYVFLWPLSHSFPLPLNPSLISQILPYTPGNNSVLVSLLTSASRRLWALSL